MLGLSVCIPFHTPSAGCSRSREGMVRCATFTSRTLIVTVTSLPSFFRECSSSSLMVSLAMDYSPRGPYSVRCICKLAEKPNGHGVHLWRFHVDRGLSWVLTCIARDVDKCHARPRTKSAAINRRQVFDTATEGAERGAS
jgi:hypothetical protein